VSRSAVTCAGGINVDRILRVDGHVVLGSSNRCTTSVAPGGVARNIAQSLSVAGTDTILFGAVGDDEDGAFLRAHCQQVGIDADLLVVTNHPTGTYTAIIDGEGSLVVGVSDMTATESLTVDQLGPIEPSLSRSAWLVADTNLPGPVLVELATMAKAVGCRLAVNAVSVAKSERVVGAPADLVFLARDEAEAVAGATFETTAPTGAELCRDALSAVGIGAAVVTLGADGAWFFDDDGVGTIPALRSDATDTTGAGDAVVGETVRNLMAGRPLATAVQRAVAVAAEVVRHVGAGRRQTNEEQ
jgi:pseudouridine kinase